MKTNFKKLALALLISSVFTSNAIAQETNTAATPAAEVIELESTKVIADPIKPATQESMLNLLNKAKNELKRKNSKANVYTASAAVDVAEDDPEYFDYLTSAYNSAVLQLKANLVLEKSGRAAFDEAKKYYNKRIPDEKLRAQMQSEVDQKIKEIEYNQNSMGYFDLMAKLVNKVVGQEPEKKKDPEDIKAKTAQTLFNDSFIERTIKTANDEIEGLIPVETFIVKNNKGQIEVGVIAYTTPRSIQLARDLRNGNQSKKTTNAKRCLTAESVANKLTTNEQLLSHFGLKYFYNENCRPSLLAYGMDSFIKEDDMNADYRSESVERARGMADKFISNFLNSNVAAEINDSKIKEKVKTAVMEAVKNSNKKTNYRRSKQKDINMIKEMSKEFSSSSSMDLIGLQDSRIWSVDNGDVEVVGVMRYYSMDSIKAAEQKFNPEPEKSSTQKATQQSVNPSVTRSSNLDEDDF